MNRTSKIIDTKNLGGSYLYIFNIFLMEYLYYHQSFMVSPDLYRYGIYCQCQDYGGCRMVQAGQDVCWGGSNKAGAQEGPRTNSSDRSRGRSRPYPINACDTWAMDLESLQVPFLCSPLAPWSNPKPA